MMTQIEAIDRYFAECVRCALQNQPIPVWPDGLDVQSSEAKRRLEYHGIALLLAQKSSGLTGWPKGLTDALQDEARLQAIWEADHCAAIVQLIEGLYRAGMASLVMKGTALAYSVYSEPAFRRRGDSDLLIEGQDRDAVREIFRQNCFQPGSDRRVLQEDWVFQSSTGFSHQVDLHWAVSSSTAISSRIESDHPRKRRIALPALSPNAMGTSPVDAFVQICINRTAHGAFGYLVEDKNILQGDRLIWAVDLHSLASQFSAEDWQQLGEIARHWGAAGSVLSGIRFAHTALGTEYPSNLMRELTSDEPAANAITTYYEASSPLSRLVQDVKASAGLSQKLEVLREHALPDNRFMRSRYPGCETWPITALHIRRLLDGTIRMLLGGKR